MSSNFYSWQIFIGFWNPHQITASRTHDMWAFINLANLHIKRHSNSLLLPNLEPYQYAFMAENPEEMIAFYLNFGIFIFNIGEYVTRARFHLTQFNQHVGNTFEPLMAAPGRNSHPFLKVTVIIHGRFFPENPDPSELIGSGFEQRHILNIQILSEVIKSILTGPNGLYHNFRDSRVSTSPVHVKLSLVVCMGAAGRDPEDHNLDVLERHFNESIAGRLTRMLHDLNIPFIIYAHLFPVVAGPYGKYTLEPGLQGISQHIFARFFNKRIKKKYMQQAFKWDQAGERLDVQPAIYRKSLTPGDIFFARIYRFLVLVQKKFSLSPQSSLIHFQSLIDGTLRILDGIPRGQKENFQTCLAVSELVQNYCRDHALEFDEQSWIARKLGRKSETRTAFDEILSFCNHALTVPYVGGSYEGMFLDF